MLVSLDKTSVFWFVKLGDIVPLVAFVEIL